MLLIKSHQSVLICYLMHAKTVILLLTQDIHTYMCLYIHIYIHTPISLSFQVALARPCASFICAGGLVWKIWHYLTIGINILQKYWKPKENLALFWLWRSRGCALRVSGESLALFVLSALNCFWLLSLWRCWASLISSSHTQRVLTQQGKKTGFHRVFQLAGVSCWPIPARPGLQSPCPAQVCPCPHRTPRAGTCALPLVCPPWVCLDLTFSRTWHTAWIEGF